MRNTLRQFQRAVLVADRGNFRDSSATVAPAPSTIRPTVLSGRCPSSGSRSITLRRHPTVDLGQLRADGNHAPGLARTEPVGQLHRSASGVFHGYCRSHTRDIHCHPTHVRQRHRPLQLGDGVEGPQTFHELGPRLQCKMVVCDPWLTYKEER